jgi:hypothetical protein
MTLSNLDLYPLNGFIERLAFHLCPLYILGFAPMSWISLIVLVLFSNAVPYGLPLAVVGAFVGALRKGPESGRVSSS